MTGQPYFPRLQRDTARKLLADYSTLTIDALANQAALESDRSYWYPTAPTGQHVSTGLIGHFQGTVREIAKRHGYPVIPGIRDPARGRFDRDVVGQILDLVPLLPAEAAQESVWSFLSLVVVPDVTFWRWPNAKEKDEYERILGYPRNAYRRLWWRAFTFGVGPDAVGDTLLEDEAVAILERTTIGGNRVLALAIANTHIHRFENASKRTDLLRDAMKRIRRLHAFISFHSLSDDEILGLVEEAFDQAEDLLSPTVASMPQRKH